MILDIINQNVSVFCPKHISKDERQIILIYMDGERSEREPIPAHVRNEMKEEKNEVKKE